MKAEMKKSAVDTYNHSRQAEAIAVGGGLAQALIGSAMTYTSPVAVMTTKFINDPTSDNLEALIGAAIALRNAKKLGQIS